MSSCDQTAWKAAADAYEAGMGVLHDTCVSYEQLIQATADAKAAYEAAQQAEAEGLTAYEAAKSNAATLQTAVAVESEKLGVVCQCPEEQP